MPDKKEFGVLKKIINIILGVLGAWVFLRFLLPWLFPFILALLTARLIEPVVRKLCVNFNMKRGFSSALCATAALAAVAAVAAFVVARAVYEISGFIRQLPEMLSTLPISGLSLEDKVYGFIVAAPVEVQDSLKNAFDSISEKFSTLPGEISGRFLTAVTAWASHAPAMLFAFATYVIGLYFISGSYPVVAAFIMRQVPRRWHEKVRAIKDDLRGTLGKWLKAQLMLMTITFCELTVAFLILRIEYAVLLALLVALVDSLPVLGTGTVLIPWAAVAFLTGDIYKGAVIIVTYGVVGVVRSFLEPKLVGAQVGMHPVASLLAMYVGFSTIGVLGMILFPLILMMLKELNDNRHIRLWK